MSDLAVDITSMRAYTDGAVYSHVVGGSPTAPTDASTALNVGFLEVGAVTEDGITEATKERKSWFLCTVMWSGVSTVIPVAMGTKTVPSNSKRRVGAIGDTWASPSSSVPSRWSGSPSPP